MDAATRVEETRKNPAAILALAWYSATSGRGEKDMVILHLQGSTRIIFKIFATTGYGILRKRIDLDGLPVNQGIAVYGNKGSTDQHAYVQQLREGFTTSL